MGKVLSLADYRAQEFLKKYKEAWCQLKPVQEQMRMLAEMKRFVVACAGRRSGKTERAKRKVALEAMKNPGAMYACGAPTHDQAKKIFWKDLLALLAPYIVDANTTERRIRLLNGAEIYVLGLDKPERWEGIPWRGIVIDEIANTKASAWDENIKPALNTYRPGVPMAWAWLIGVPEGLNHYYDIATYAKEGKDDDWGFYTWFSSEVLPPEVLDKEKARLSPRIYRQEYEASFETATGRSYDDYSDANHCNITFNPALELIWSHDFNYAPMSSVLMQNVNGKMVCVDEIVLDSAVASNSAQEFIERYRGNERLPIRIYGDATDGNEGFKHGFTTDFQIMEKMLKSAGFANTKVLTYKSNGRIKERQNVMRGQILNANGQRSFLVNPSKCPTVDKGFKTTTLKANSVFEEIETRFQHITTAVGYYYHYQHRLAQNAYQIG